MKKIEAIIRLTKFDEVRDALASIGVNFFTMKDVKGFGLQKGEKLVYRGSVYGSDYIARLQLDIITDDAKVDHILGTIIKAARTGDIGDGKITVLNVSEVVRIRTGEVDVAAV
ncbi:MAG: P-II family nitrogen regulator [Bacteroidota bacterium]